MTWKQWWRRKSICRIPSLKKLIPGKGKKIHTLHSDEMLWVIFLLLFPSLSGVNVNYFPLCLIQGGIEDLFLKSIWRQ
jgi:hypothetical protein